MAPQTSVGNEEIDLRQKHFVVLVEYLEQQENCSRCQSRISKSRRTLSWRNQVYLRIGKTPNTYTFRVVRINKFFQ